MSNWIPAQAAPNGTTIGHASGTAYGTLLSASPAAANTFGAWAQLVASSAVDCGGILVCFTNASTSTRFAIQIGVGAAAAEKVVIDKLLWQSPRANNGGESYFIPVMIKASSRIAARVSATASSTTLSVCVVLLPLSVSPVARFNRTTAYGFATGDGASGTSIDPGTTLNTKGAYAQLVASTANPIKFLLLMIGLQANTIASDANFRLDLAIGAAGSEQIIIPDLVFETSAGSDDMDVHCWAIPCAIKEGSRISARAQTMINDSFDRFVDVALLGVD